MYTSAYEFTILANVYERKTRFFTDNWKHVNFAFRERWLKLKEIRWS